MHAHTGTDTKFYDDKFQVVRLGEGIRDAFFSSHFLYFLILCNEDSYVVLKGGNTLQQTHCGVTSLLGERHCTLCHVPLGNTRLGPQSHRGPQRHSAVQDSTTYPVR